MNKKNQLFVILFFLLLISCAFYLHYLTTCSTNAINDKTNSGDNMLHLLRHGNNTERRLAAEFIGRDKDESAVQSLIGALDDPHQSVRGWAAWALGEIGDESAIGPLIYSMVKHYKKFDKGGPQEFSTLIIKRDVEALPDYCEALRKLTGKDYGLEVTLWQQWWLNDDRT